MPSCAAAVSRQWVAVLATDGVLAGPTAGRLWGIYDPTDDDIHVVVISSRHITTPAGVRLHRTDLPTAHVRVRAGLPVTDRPWAVLDLLGSLPWPAASTLADRALQRGWLRRIDCERRLTDFPRRPGNAQLRRVTAQLGDGAAATSERVLHRMLRAARATGWTPNYEVWRAGELIAVVDVAWPEFLLAVEIDGMAYHVDVARFRGDRIRQNTLVALGWTVLRFTWADLTERPGYMLSTISRMTSAHRVS
ncbi:MAG: endonuclease domain-containing protein [Actinomycetota bacterium]|nr:endonuclease domain-containing protein [Actinomycetota bacterium]